MKSGPIDADDRERTVEEAAELLSLSVEYVIDLLDRGDIPCRAAGTDRRIKASDLVAYKQRDDAERGQILDELTAEAQRHGLGY